MPSNIPELSEWAVRKAIRAAWHEGTLHTDKDREATYQGFINDTLPIGMYNRIESIALALMEAKDEGIEECAVKVETVYGNEGRKLKFFTLSARKVVASDLRALKSTQEVKTNG